MSAGYGQFSIDRTLVGCCYGIARGGDDVAVCVREGVMWG